MNGALPSKGDPVAELPYLFVREMIGRRPAVALARRGRDGRHVRLWTLAFELPVDRETLFAWLEANVLMWPVLGALAASAGGRALSDHLDKVAGAQVEAAGGTLIQVYRAAAYLTCTEDWLLSFRDRPGCAALFADRPDPHLAGREVVFVDLGGLVPQIMADAYARAREEGL